MIAGRGIETESWLKKIINTLNCPDITSMIITFRSSVTNVYANQNCGGSMFGWCLLPLSMNNSWQCGWFNRLFVVPYDRAITIKVEGGRGGGSRFMALGGGRKEFVKFITRFDSVHLKPRCSPVSVSGWWRPSYGKIMGVWRSDLYRAKLVRPVETCAKFLRISLKLIEFFSSRFLLY